MKYFRKILSLMISVLILIGTVAPSLQPSFAVSSDVFNPSFAYNSGTGNWDITWTPIAGSTGYEVTYNEVDFMGDVTEITKKGETANTVNGRNILSLSFLPDYIYDLKFEFNNDTGNINFRDKYNALVYSDTIFFLSDITFEGTSFNDMAVFGGLTDAAPNRTLNSDNQAIKVTSGESPKITVRWKVPTIYSGSEVVPITQLSKDNYDMLEAGGTSSIDIDYSYFHIRMNEVTDRVTEKNYRTTLKESITTIRESNKAVSGFGSDGEVIASDGFVSYTFDQSDGIIPGTEYENVNIRLFFWNNDRNSQAIFSRLVYGYNVGEGFEIENRDNAFMNIVGRMDSIFTPMMFEVNKVDIDKIEVRMRKIESKNYTELYYQVLDAGTDLVEELTNLSSGVKLPDSSIPDSTGWGSMIIEIPLNENGEHPERYYRVIVTDGDSYTPLGSLAIDLRSLDNDTGKPPIPRDIEISSIYNGKQEVIYKNPDTKITIPLTDLKLSFEKPLLWRTKSWDEIQQAPDSETDFTFHILLNTYLSDNVVRSETRVIGDEQELIFMPVTEKRVLTFGKHDVYQDPQDSRRLVFELDGAKLFYDYYQDTSLSFENDVDFNADGYPDYPDFLVPNTTYYLKMFSTRAKDNDINWSQDGKDGLNEKISYISPTVSFTTYPLQDLPLPLPNVSLGLNMDDEPEPETGKPVFNGITLSFPKILKDNDWQNYTNLIDGRKIVYDIYISEKNEEGSFIFLKSLETLYPDEYPNMNVSTLVTEYPGASGDKIKPNTTYYFKVRATLYVNNEDRPFVIGDETPVKSITTPKTDSGSMEDLERLPRTPVEFSIATDSNGQLQVTDSKVTLAWLHAEQDVTYEMVCTTKKLDTDASIDDYINDEYNTGDQIAPGFLVVYKDYKTNSDDTELNIDVLNTKLDEVGFAYNVNRNRIARFPINLPFLKPNQLYYFSIRAVRDRDSDDATYSSWVSIPVTTKMVTPPKFLEAVNDVQLGFNIMLSGGIPQENIKILLKKAYQSDESYVEISRAKYTVVRDGRRYYFRLYDLEPDTWYDIQPFYNVGDEIVWYDSDDEDWGRRDREPIQMKTRNTLSEIEIRFEGEAIYDYFIEVRTDYSEDYIQLVYDTDPEDSDYGYTLEDGRTIEFYREKTSVYADDSQSDKYMYYAKIYQARQRRSDGSYDRERLLSNTRYYIKIWSRNEADSSRVGPVTIRTDFNQKDYDDDYKRDEITDIFESKADKLTQKLYFTVDELDSSSNRVLLKGAMISNFMKVADHSGITVDISEEKPDVQKDIIIVPMEILETLQVTTSRLTIKLSGCELSLTKDTVNLDDLRKSVAVTGVKETMLEITVQRKQEASVRPISGYLYGSNVYDIEFNSLSMSRTYAQINEIIYDILKEPKTSGPFKYGILDSELNNLLERQSVLSYQSQTDLDNVIALAVEKVEEQLSLYIKDIIDGGRGLSASVLRRNELTQLHGGIKLKVLQNGSSGLSEPYVLSNGASSWTKPSGIKGWVFPYILFTAKVPGEYTVLSAPKIILPEIDGFIDLELKRFSQEYDLRSIFGNALYPGDFVSADNAVNLFEAVTETQSEVAGLSTPAKVRYYNLNEFISPPLVNQVLNKGQANSLVIEIYAFKTGVSSDMMRPSTFMHITNAERIPDAIYNRLIIALDLGVTELEADYSYKYESKATVEETLHSIITVLELLGEW